MPERTSTIRSPRVAFGDLVRLSRERSADPATNGYERYVGLDHLDPGSLRIRRWGRVAEGTTFTTVFRSGQTLFGKRRAYQRKVTVADFDGVCSGDIYVLEAKDARLMPGLLPFICQTQGFFDHAIRTSAGSLSPRTNWESLATYEFALPPVDEQLRMVSLLRAIATAEDACSELLATLDTARVALVASKVGELGRLWPRKSLGDVAEVKYGFTLDASRRGGDNHVPYLRVANVVRGDFDLREIKDVGSLPGDEEYQLQSGDILVVEGHANPTEIGRAAVWSAQRPRMLHQNHLIRVRCGDGELIPEFLASVMNSSHGRAHFRSYAKSSSGLNTINSSVVKDYVIPVPSREVQAEVVELVELASGLTVATSTRRQGIVAMRETLLRILGEAA